MYAAFFCLRQTPFSIAPDPRYLFMSERHREALAHLLYGVESGGGFVLLTGEIGAGKTTVCRRLLGQLPAHARVAYIFNPKLTVEDLLETICHEFGVAVRHDGPGPATIKDHLDPLNEHLLSSHAAGEHNVLIIDEAQSLNAEVLEQLRLLTNLETNERKLLQIILIGQPELRQMLARPELEQLAQRVIARYHLGPLSEAETRQYIAHRMAVAGWSGESPPFTSEALRRVHQLSGGVPRRINLLCDRALLGAYATARNEVDKAIIERASLEVFDGLPVSRQTTARGNDTRGWRQMALGVIAGAALAGGAAFWWGNRPTTLDASPYQPSAVLPTPEAHEGAPPATAIDKPNVLATLPPGPPPASAWMSSEDDAFSALSVHWGPRLNVKQPCADARRQQLQCYRTPNMTMNGLRQLDRPAILKLQVPGQGSGYVLASAMNDQAVELSVGEQRWRVPLSALSSVWNGEYATLWRTPPGQKDRMNNGYVGPAAAWMEQRLTELQKAGQLPNIAQTLEEKVEAFQRVNGIVVNGKASPTTLIMINRASGVDEPRLVTPVP